MTHPANEPCTAEAPHSGAWILVKIIGLMVLLPMLVVFVLKLLVE